VGSILVQQGFEAWFYGGTGVIMSSSMAERLALLAFVLLNPGPIVVFVAILGGLAALGAVGWWVGVLALALLVSSLAVWWWGVARVVGRLAARRTRVVA